MKRKLFSIAQIVITVGLLYYLMRKVDLRASLEIIKQVKILLLIFSAFLFVLFLLVGAWRWKILLDARKINFSMRYLTKVYFISWFFNNILPTSIGGDVLRIAYTIRQNNISGKRETSPAFAAVFVDRFIGFIGLFFFALLAATALFLMEKGQKQYLLINLFGFIILMVILLAVFSDAVHKIFSRIFSRIKIFRLGEKFERAYLEIKEYRAVKFKLVISFLLSLLVQLLSSFIWYFIGFGVAVKTSILYYCLFIPVIGIFTMIPITVGGLGMRENMFVNIFNSVANVSKEKATAISGLYLIINLIFAFIGGIMFLLVKKIKINN
ncbi:MAG: flippase-like domain-containing protein [candidate division WOR-3 bacterium]|nr:flippase-like domain-containing protein [candidate division WOR-3 bacterium]